MIYGLYQSAAGIMTDSYRQDVIANNIANSETVGFRRDLAMIQQRPTAAQERLAAGLAPADSPINQMMEHLGGGMLASPTQVDTSEGDMESTGNDLDVALQGNGYFAVSQGKNVRLTRDGQFAIDNNGNLVLSNEVGQTVLDANQAPIHLDGNSPVLFGTDGTITQNGKVVAQLGLFDVSDESKLSKQGATLLAIGANQKLLPATPGVRSQFIERSNVDPANELTQLMETQRQLEANANMIRTQDETLDKLMNDVGKIG